jgi:hypothetical protein
MKTRFLTSFPDSQARNDDPKNLRNLPLKLVLAAWLKKTLIVSLANILLLTLGFESEQNLAVSESML